MAVFHGEQFHVSSAWVERLAAVGILAGANWSEQSGGEVMSASALGQVRRISLNDEVRIYFKAERYPLSRRFKFWLRPARTTVEVFAYAKLFELGIPTLTTIAWGERRVFGLPTETLVVTLAVHNSADLRAFASETWRNMCASERKVILRSTYTALADQLRCAHARGFVHHDLKWRNVLMRETENGYEPVWIDPPRAAIWRLRRRRGAVVDLSDLARPAVFLISRYHRMRFLLRYLGRHRQPGAATALWRDIDARVSRRRSREQDVRLSAEDDPELTA
jgi:hypothetical protein